MHKTTSRCQFNCVVLCLLRSPLVQRCIEVAIAEIRSGGGVTAGHGHLGHHGGGAAGAIMPGAMRSHLAAAAGGMGHMFRTY